jgi:RimJ/RimL family protein N-acetyltransferase
MGTGLSANEPPCIVLDEAFALSGWEAEDAVAHRRFALDSEAAKFLGWTVEQARAAPDSHYEDVIRRFEREWQDGTRYSLAVRRRADGEAVGSVELRIVGDQADVSYLVVAEQRGQGLAPRAVEAMLAWVSRVLALRQANIACHVDNTPSRRVAEKCGFVFVDRTGEEAHFRRDLGQSQSELPSAPNELFRARLCA